MRQRRREAGTPFSHLRGGNCRELLFAAAALKGTELVLENVARGVFLIPFQLSRVATPVRNIMRKYSDLPADFADACLIQLADELNTGEILTLDRDFAHYRWRRTRRFDVLIDVK
jgi:predicted nucleic acid-binding protein